MSLPERLLVALTLARIPGYANESPHRVIAEEPMVSLLPNMETVIILRPVWGSAAPYYRVRFWFTPGEAELRPGWLMGRVALDLDNQHMGLVPFTLYVGEPLDEPSMMAKFPEVHRPDDWTDRPKIETGTWLLTGRRAA